MLVCLKDFQQYKEGDILPSKLNEDVAKLLIRDGYAKFAGRNKNAIVVDYIRRTKNDPNKDYFRKRRGPNKKKTK